MNGEGLVESRHSYYMNFKKHKYVTYRLKNDPFFRTHREDGPAIIHYDGQVEWVLKGNPMHFEEWLEHVALLHGPEHAAIMKLKWSKVNG